MITAPVPRAAFAAVIAIALAVRVAFALLTPREIHWPDGREYEAVALSLVEEGSYGVQTLRPPGYPTLIAAVYWLFGRDLLVLRLVEAALGATTVAMMGLFASIVFGPVAGLLAAALTALHPVLSFLPSTQYSENTLLLALVPALGLALVPSRNTALRWGSAGFLFGLAALVRPNVVLLLPGLLIGLALPRRHGRASVAVCALLLVAGLAIAVAPWVVRSHRVHGEWFFIASGGGRALWLANNPHASAATNTVSWPDSVHLAQLMQLPDDRARDRLWTAWAVQFIREDPARAARLYLGRIRNLFALYPETYSRTPFMSDWSRWAQGLASFVIFTGALVAIVRGGHPAIWPLVGAIASFALVNSVFWSVLRYRLAFEPCLIWLAGRGWAEVIARMVAAQSNSRWRKSVSSA